MSQQSEKKKKPRLETGELDPGRDILGLLARRSLVQPQAVKKEVAGGRGGVGRTRETGTDKVLSTGRQRISSDIGGRERQKKKDMK